MASYNNRKLLQAWEPVEVIDLLDNYLEQAKRNPLGDYFATSRSDFVRRAVREKLKELGVL